MSSTPVGPRLANDFNPRTDPPLDFPDKSLWEMTAEDYRTLGFMCGLEVHQQIHTRGKLFCRCPAGRRAHELDAEVLRHMRPTLSELGEYDGTALMEFKTKKEIVYLLERESVCTYEIDDTPPFEIDEEAVKTSIEVASLFNLNLVSELHVMRKQYLDGSIPTGFQRTAMVGLSGAIPFRVPELGIDRELRIRQLSLEEDSCREVSDIGHRITFWTDRLGTPLTEAVTEPELLTPQEVLAGAHLVARTAQVTGKVRRGPGAARQDTNVSIAGGRRTEIKGVQHQSALPRLVHIEAFRQLNLLRVKAELEKRGVPAELLSVPAKGLPWEQSPLVAEVGDTLRGVDFAPIRDALEMGQSIACVRLPAFAGLLAHGTQPGVTFAREFAERVRVVGCLTARPFMLHSDVKDYGISSAKWRQLRQRVNANKWDALMIVWGPAADVATAAREILIRAQDALIGIPSETRQANVDGTTGFERILPGPDRMYPDTDTPPVRIPNQWIADIQTALPERPWERMLRYEALGLSVELARRLEKAPWSSLFDELGLHKGALARRVAYALERCMPYLRRAGVEPWLPQASRVRPLIEAVAKGTVRVEALETCLRALVSQPQTTEAIIGRFTAEPNENRELDARATQLAPQMAKIKVKGEDVALRWAMGQVMPRFLGRLSPAVVADKLTEVLAARSHP